MGSFLDTYLRQRDLRSFFRNQQDNIATQLSAVDEQVRQIIERGACPRGELARSAYLHEYVIGILDAITSFYEKETRKRFGLELYREAFVRYLRDRFFLSRHEADTLFAAARACASAEGEPRAMRDGYADGLLALRNGNRPQRLMNTFTSPPMMRAEVNPMADFAAAAGA